MIFFLSKHHIGEMEFYVNLQLYSFLYFDSNFNVSLRWNVNLHMYIYIWWFFKEMSYPIVVLLYADCHKSLLVKILSIPWLMMLWLLASPGHQQPWSWQCTKLEQHLPPHDNIGHKHLWNDIWCRLLLWWHRYKVWQRWARIFEAPDEKPGKPKASCECCKMKKNQENNFQWNILITRSNW